MIIDTLIRMAFVGEQAAPEANVKDNPQSSALNSLLNEQTASQPNEQVAARLDVERLKLIDEISRVILELKKQFPELAQSLEKARDNISVNLETVSVKNLQNILNAIQQNLNKPEYKQEFTPEFKPELKPELKPEFKPELKPEFKPEFVETVRNLVNEALKILRPSTEIPPENKLLLALSQNDFAKADIAIRNIIENSLRQAEPTVRAIPAATTPAATTPAATTPAAAAPMPATPQTFQVILNALQELKTLGIPIEFQNTPLKELEAVVLQKTGIEIDKSLAKNLQTIFNEKPAYAVAAEIPLPKNILQIILQAIPKASETIIPNSPTPYPANASSTPPPANSQPPTNANVPPANANVPPANANPPPASVNMPPINTKIANININIPTININMPPINTNSANTPPVPQTVPQKPEIAFSLYQIIAAPSTPDPQPQISAPQSQIPASQPQIHTFEQQTTTSELQIPTPELRIPISEPQIPTSQPQTTTSELQIPTPHSPNPKPHTPLPTPQTPYPIPSSPLPTPQFILQIWPASIHIPKEERDFWLKTELPLTPQIIELRNTILSFGKLPEEPQMVRLFAENLHEMSLKTENSVPVTKEQVNLLWRLMQLQFSTPGSPASDSPGSPAPDSPEHPVSSAATPLKFSILNSQLLKYQPIGNHEGELLKTLPEAVRKEVLHELPEGKTWQPEMLQKAVEKILEKHTAMPHSPANEEVRQILQNLKEQIQWTRIDHDTRPQAERENVFYFMHNEELQKGRLKIKDERKGGNKKQQGSPISFSISTHTKNLGDVHADLTLSKNILSIRLQDSFGAAGEAVKEERETLAKELADIGISLGELLYGKTPKIRSLPISKTEEKSKGGLDLRA